MYVTSVNNFMKNKKLKYNYSIKIMKNLHYMF